MKSPYFFCKIISDFYPSLADKRLLKNGFYYPREILQDNIIILALKRFIRQKMEKNFIEPNFKLDMWLYEFIVDRFRKISEQNQENIVNKLFNTIMSGIHYG